jgi:hypothetical protein
VNKKSVVIFSFRSQDWALASALEIVARELEFGSHVYWAFWLENLSFPKELPLSEKLTSIYLKKEIQSTKLLELLKNLSKGGQIEFLDMPGACQPTLSLLNEKVDIASYLELISRIRESKPLKDSYRRLVRELNCSYIETYSAVAQVLQSKKPDTVFLYNGRFLQERAVADCCASLGIKVVYFERFNPEWKTRYFLFEQSTHSPSYRSQIMQDYGLSLQSSSPEEFQSVGGKWFKDRQLGVSQNFTRYQNQKPILDTLGDYVVFFHSSEDELITTDLTSISWGSQMEAINQLVKVVQGLQNLKLVIRIHPNLKYKSKKEILEWKKFEEHLSGEYEWIHVLNHENKTNSYELILGAKNVVTVGSTIGVEAAYLGKRSILIGRAFHEEMGITSNPVNSEELRRFLTTDLTDEEHDNIRNRALSYANFHKSGGQEFNYVTYSGLPFGRYFWQDVSLSRPFFIRAIFRIESKVRSISLIISNMFRRVE